MASTPPTPTAVPSSENESGVPVSLRIPFRMTSRKSSWMTRHLMSLLGMACVGFFLLLVAFESKLHLKRQQRRPPHDARQPEEALESTAKQPRESRKAPLDKLWWKPLNSECAARKGPNAFFFPLDPFPPSFDPELYQELHGRGKDFHHYVQIGRDQGYECTRGQHMRELFNSELLPPIENAILQQYHYDTDHTNEQDVSPLLILEIGPFLNPMLMGKDVLYFDILPLDKLKERATQIGYPAVHTPSAIDYVHPSGDLLAAIPERNRFALVASSHVIPNQLDLVRHLQAVGALLVDGGYYAIAMTDKRRTFDHLLPTTGVAQVLEDYYDTNSHNRTSHRLKSLVEHRAMTSPPHTPRPERSEGFVDRVQQAVVEYEQNSSVEPPQQEKVYIDVHNYHFTPHSFATVVDLLYNLQLIDVRVHRLYDTMQGTNEFSAILQKCSGNRKSSSTQ